MQLIGTLKSIINRRADIPLILDNGKRIIYNMDI
jgi:hypothetical protein